MVSRAPAQSACPCDWNQNGIVNSQDLFDFLGSFFAGQADFNQNGVTDSQDFFDFVTCFLDPPPSCGQCASFVNIRTLVDGSADDPPNIQANYDSLNRLLYLCGDLTLAQVLTSPFGQLVPGIAQRLPNVQGCTGAATNVGAVQAALNNAAAVSGGIPIGQLLTIRQGTNPPIELAFAQLRSAGVPFPEFSLNQQQSDARAATLPNVIANAGDLRVADLAYRSRSSFTPMENQALDEVHLSGLFYLASCRNDRCCCSQGFLCVASVGSFCSRSLDGPCSWDSSTCPDPQPIQCRH
jgi:hypothetical protein